MQRHCRLLQWSQRGDHLGRDVVTETRTGREWGLASLAQLAANTPEDHWTEMVQRHLDSIAALDVAIP